MTTTVTPAARRSITLNHVARIGLVSVLALTVAACATRQQRDSMAQLNAGRMVQTVLDRVSEDPAPGIKQTVDVKKSMYSEVIGGLQGARTTSAVAGESWAARYEAEPGLTLTRFDKGPEKVYCTTVDFVYNGLAGWNPGCMVDRDGNGTFDLASRQAWDSYSDAAEATLSPPVSYEEITLDEPQFATTMRLSYQGKDVGDVGKFSVIGFVTSGSDIDDRQLGYPTTSTHSVRPGSNISILGVNFVVHEATDTSITYTILDGGFTEVQRLDMKTLGIVRRQIKN